MDEKDINEMYSPKLEAMMSVFDDRQMCLIDNCNVYANGKPAGLPGHNIMIIVSKLYDLLCQAYGETDEKV